MDIVSESAAVGLEGVCVLCDRLIINGRQKLCHCTYCIDIPSISGFNRENAVPSGVGMLTRGRNTVLEMPVCGRGHTDPNAECLQLDLGRFRLILLPYFGSTRSVRPWTPLKESAMKMIMNVSIPHEPFNTLVKNGQVGDILHRILDELKPESIYFTEQEGTRGAVAIIDVEDSSKIPFFAEPFFLNFNADVEFRIAMSPEDLGKSGLEELGRKWG